MLADDPAKGLEFRLAVVGADLPDDLPGFLADNQDDVGFAPVNDDVVGMEALVARVVPLVRAKHGHGVDVHPVAQAGGFLYQAAAAEVGVTAHGVAGLFGKAHFLNMIGTLPFPYDFALPVDLVDHVINQGLVADVRHMRVTMAENERIAGIDSGLHAGGVVAGSAALALEIMVLTGHPLGFLAGVLDEFGLVEFPHHVAAPVHLNKVKLILKPVFGMPGSPAAHEHAAGEHLVRKTLHVFPKTDFMPVHADEQSALVRGGQNGIAVPGFFRIEDGDAGGIDSWMSHIRSPCVVRRNFCPAGLMFFFRKRLNPTPGAFCAQCALPPGDGFRPPAAASDPGGAMPRFPESPRREFPRPFSARAAETPSRPAHPACRAC